MIDAFDQMIQTNGSTADVTLRNGTQFSMRMALRGRNPNEPLTDGISERRAWAQFMASRWEAAAPADRDPEKGDHVTMNGRRRAISSVEVRAIDDVRVVFLILLEG